MLNPLSKQQKNAQAILIEASDTDTDDVDDNIFDNSKGKNLPRKKSVVKAPARDYFEIIEVDGVKYYIFRIQEKGVKCNKRFKHFGSTTRMNEHLSVVHKLKDFTSREHFEQTNYRKYPNFDLFCYQYCFSF